MKMGYFLRFFSFYFAEVFLNILLKFVLHVANNEFSDKFNNDGGILSSMLLFNCM